MQLASAASTAADLADALAQIDATLVVGGAPASPDLVLVFVSPDYGDALQTLPALVAARWPGALLFGGSAAGVVGGGHELEGERAVSVTVASLPGVALRAMHLDVKALVTAHASPFTLASRLGDAPVVALVLPEPFSCNAERLVAAFDIAWSEVPLLGGLVSGARERGGHLLFVGEQLHSEGAAILALSGDIAVDAVVASGCRPIGPVMRVTQCEQNLLFALDGVPAAERLTQVFGAVTDAERKLMKLSVFFGLEVAQGEEPADYLVRNIIGSDPARGLLAVGGALYPQQRVRLHVRDAATSAEDLRRRIAELPRPAGALMFSCLGRGEGLYGQPDHDTAMLRARFPELPVGGFFCNGEIGPVGGETFLHGFTSSIALLRPASTD